MSAPLAAFDTHVLWEIALGMGAVVLVVVTVLMMLLLSLIKDIETSVGSLLFSAGTVASYTANLPKLGKTPAVLDLIIEEAVVQDGYMNALTDGYGGAAA